MEVQAESGQSSMKAEAPDSKQQSNAGANAWMASKAPADQRNSTQSTSKDSKAHNKHRQAPRLLYIFVCLLELKQVIRIRYQQRLVCASCV